jgi:hypothetical protein
MSQPDSDILKQAQEYIRSKQLPQAQRMLVAYIKQNPNSEQAWYLLSTAVDDPRKQIECLQRVLRLNPANTEAQTRLMKVMATQAEPGIPAPPPVKSQPPASEPPPFTLPIIPPPIEKPVPRSQPRPIEPAPMAAVEPIEPAVSTADTELSGLRSKMKFVKLRKPRKRWPRIVLLLLLIALIAAVGGRLLWDKFNEGIGLNGTPAAVVVPTDTPPPTNTPTVTPTPSITPTRYPATWTPTPAPTTPPTRTPTPIPTLNPAVQTGLLRLRDQIAAARGVGADTIVPAALLPRNAVETTLRSILDIQQLQPELANQARALALLGLVRPEFDLSRYVVNRFADNAGGFYVPWQDVILVAGTEFGGVEGIAYTHQMAHALLERRFDLEQQGLYPACTRGDEQCQVLQALVEGDTALATDRWLEQNASKLYKEASSQYQALPAAINDPTAPPFVARDVAFRSTQGRAFVDTLYQRGGWSAVNNAYESLPVSTEQILHPQKFVEGEQPVAVAAAPLFEAFGGNWRGIADETLGEWRTYLLLSAGVDEAARLSEETAQKAAAGWGGDHYQVYYDQGTDQAALVVEWVWDTPEDATEFQQAMSAYLDLRFRGAKAQIPDQDCWSANRQTTCLYTSDNRTLWVLAPSFDIIDQVHQAYPDFK